MTYRYVSVLLAEGLLLSSPAWPLPESISSRHHSAKNNGTSAFALDFLYSQNWSLRKSEGIARICLLRGPTVLRKIRTYRKTVFSYQGMKPVMVWAKKERDIYHWLLLLLWYCVWKLKMALKIENNSLHFYKHFLHTYYKPGNILSPGPSPKMKNNMIYRKTVRSRGSVKLCLNLRSRKKFRWNYCTSLRWARNPHWDVGTDFCSKLEQNPTQITIKSSIYLLLPWTHHQYWLLSLISYTFIFEPSQKITICFFWSFLHKTAPCPIFVAARVI